MELQVKMTRHLSRIGGFVKENTELWGADVGWNFFVCVSQGSIGFFLIHPCFASLLNYLEIAIVLLLVF